MSTIVPAEILDDEFYDAIVDAIKAVKPPTIFDIGSSTGEGSTQAIIEAVVDNDIEARAWCFEVDAHRYNQLEANVTNYPFIAPVWGSTVKPEEFLPDPSISIFTAEHKHFNIGQYSLGAVQKWCKKDRKMAREVPNGTLFDTMQAHDITIPGFVLIDGSAFSAHKEMALVYGAWMIALDDTHDIKNWQNYCELQADSKYKLWRENSQLRNGYAIFRKVG